MSYVIVLLLGAVAGAIVVYVLLEGTRKRLDELAAQRDEGAREAEAALQETRRRRQELDELAERLRTGQRELEVRLVSYQELHHENAVLKHDLQNVDVNLRKLQLDGELQLEAQERLDKRSKELGGRYLKDSINWISRSLTPNSFVNCSQRLRDALEWCRRIGFGISAEEEEGYLANLREEYKKIVRVAFEREEQARIRAQIREEQRMEKEIERELKQLERERAAIQAALEKALAETKDEHSAEVEQLRTRLAEAEERAQRKISQAQLTKSGHVYVISNIGSFGESVFKIGLTRRLEPLERVKELGDASVPFPFDVHMMVSSNDAPSLENALHRAFHKLRLNKVNPRKEFFRAEIDEIRRVAEEHHGEVQYVADAEALEYRQSLTISEEELEFIERVYDEVEEGTAEVAED